MSDAPKLIWVDLHDPVKSWTQFDTFASEADTRYVRADLYERLRKGLEEIAYGGIRDTSDMAECAIRALNGDNQ